MLFINDPFINMAFKEEKKHTLIIPTEIEIPVYEMELSYMTVKGNYKTKNYYFLGHLNYGDEEYLDFSMDEISEQLDEMKHWSNITVYSIKKLGNVYYPVDKNSYTKNFDKRKLKHDDKRGLLCELLNKIHPKQIVFEKYGFKTPFIKIEYYYKTNRGNERKNEKYFISHEDCETLFYKWLNSFNKKYPYRAISNLTLPMPKGRGFFLAATT